MRRTGGETRSGRLRPVDAMTLFAVVAVVVLVSLPRLRDFALHENETDAVSLTRTLSRAIEGQGPERPATIGQLLTSDEDLQRRLLDADLLEEGRLLRRHGYLFDLCELEAGGVAVRAWPWNYGQTGLGAFVVLPDGRGLGHANEDRAWSGPDSPPSGPWPPPREALEAASALPVGEIQATAGGWRALR